MSLRRHLPAAVALLAIAALPLLAERLRGHPERCEMDGVAIDRAFRVRVAEEGGATHGFCGVTCAASWIARRGIAPAAVLVTDGASGREIDAGTAWFVRTLGNVSDGAPDPIRVFARREAAERHASVHGGHVLKGSERPFAGAGEGHAKADD
ncbi:MAG: nitrous oxide reductase accessory protein NosL [Planctomycetes bacterium]|nr:nitrous oxide reductase accessory protein NosL [Planctomycetota bacterium]